MSYLRLKRIGIVQFIWVGSIRANVMAPAEPRFEDDRKVGETSHQQKGPCPAFKRSAV